MPALRNPPDPAANDHRKKIVVLFLVLGVIVLAGGYLLAVVASDEDEGITPDRLALRSNETSVLREEDEGPVHEFFSQIFGGINEGLQEGAENSAARVADVDMGLAGEGTADDSIPAIGDPFEDDTGTETQPLPEAAMPLQERNYQDEIQALFGVPITGEDGKELGVLYDILAQPGTGEARGLLLEADGGERIVMLPWELVRIDGPDDVLTLAMSAGQFGDQPPIADELQVPREVEDISLRTLRESAVIDTDGNPVGSVEAITFSDGAVQSVFFVVTGPSEPPLIQRFSLSMPEITLIREADGYLIQLSNEQTRYVAELLVPGAIPDIEPDAEAP